MLSRRELVSKLLDRDAEVSTQLNNSHDWSSLDGLAAVRGLLSQRSFIRRELDRLRQDGAQS
jgi:hypothetical protein